MRVDERYLNFKFKDINKKEYRHIYLILYWPIFCLLFIGVEKFVTSNFHIMHMALDDIIPFNEWFIIPYCIWYLFWTLPLIYTFHFEVDMFKRLSYFLIATYTLSFLIFIIYPTCQNLRPECFERENFLTYIVSLIYSADTNTNVCPSMHVIGSFGAAFCLTNCKAFDKWYLKVFFYFLAILISVSTLFVKQHSAVDVIFGIIISIIGYFIFFFDIAKMRK